MKKLNFEESLTRLEEITQQLESGEISLDNSLKIFEEGISLSRFCEKKLTEAEQKLEILKNCDINESPGDNEKIKQDKTSQKKKVDDNELDEKDENFLF